MARRIETLLIDDLDGSAAAETVRFTWAGHDYEIDLSTANAAKMRKAVAPFTDAARRIAGGRLRISRVPEQRGPARTDPAQSRAMRDWLRARGVDVPDRGRIPDRFVEWFQAGAVPDDATSSVVPQDVSAGDGAAPAAEAVEPSTIDAAAPDEAVSEAPKRARKTAAARKSTPRKAATKAATK